MKNLKMIAAVVGLLVTGCTDELGARRILEDQGFTEIKTLGYTPFGCGRDDTFTTEFTAVNQNGRRVYGVVCSGLLKGATVRFK